MRKQPTSRPVSATGPLVLMAVTGSGIAPRLLARLADRHPVAPVGEALPPRG